MPRVVSDQKGKYDTDELFKKLSQEMDVKYTGYKDRPVEERKRRFAEDLREGHSVITFIATGTNLSLQFSASGNDENPPEKPTREAVNFDREPNRVHLCSRFIMNGVCVKWLGWVDLETLNGKARLLYDEEYAQMEDETMRRVVKEAQERVRLFEENQRRWQQEHMQSSPMQQQAVPLSQP